MGVISYNHDEEIKKIKRRIECLERTIVDCETHEMYDMGTILRDKKWSWRRIWMILRSYVEFLYSSIFL